MSALLRAQHKARVDRSIKHLHRPCPAPDSNRGTEVACKGLNCYGALSSGTEATEGEQPLFNIRRRYV